MGKPQIRSSQVLMGYGPGAMVDLPDDSVIIAGLDTWRYNNGEPLPIVEEPRLQAKLQERLQRTLTLRKPPAAIEQNHFTPDIGAYRFPEWVISQRTQRTAAGHIYRRLLTRRDLQNGWFPEDDGRKYQVVPVRFVMACPKGHVSDIDWRAFLHGKDHHCFRELYIEERGTTGDLTSVWIRCGCGAERPMSQASRRELIALGNCKGARPWLGPGNRESCGVPNLLLIRSASNAYFSQSLSVISIPNAYNAIDTIVEGMWNSYFETVETDAELKTILKLGPVKHQVIGYTAAEILSAINRIRSSSGQERPVKEVEFEALAVVQEELGTDRPGGDFFARSLPKQNWDAPWMEKVERVVLVHRLREVVAQLGFTRFEPVGTDIDGDLEVGAVSAPLSLDDTWLPAVENRGEGIFIQFKTSAILDWLGKPAVKARGRQLEHGHEIWQGDHKNERDFFGLPYYMLHSFSHMLLTAISLDCGYPPSSIRERIYARYAAGQYGILLYTGSPDAEGTLGGLVEAGRRISTHFHRALDFGRLCSNDPVCAYHAPAEHDQQPLHGSACHGCLLIAETSCEQRNDFLDRSLVVSTVEMLDAEFFD